MNLHELLLSFPNPPLIPCETAVNLLKLNQNLYPAILVYAPADFDILCTNWMLNTTKNW